MAETARIIDDTSSLAEVIELRRLPDTGIADIPSEPFVVNGIGNVDVIATQRVRLLDEVSRLLGGRSIGEIKQVLYYAQTGMERERDSDASA